MEEQEVFLPTYTFLSQRILARRNARVSWHLIWEFSSMRAENKRQWKVPKTKFMRKARVWSKHFTNIDKSRFTSYTMKITCNILIEIINLSFFRPWLENAYCKTAKLRFWILFLRRYFASPFLLFIPFLHLLPRPRVAFDAGLRARAHLHPWHEPGKSITAKISIVLGHFSRRLCESAEIPARFSAWACIRGNFRSTNAWHDKAAHATNIV